MADPGLWLYVLECDDSTFYVGRTANLSQRFRQHWDGCGSAWTRAHPPIAAVAVRPARSAFDEDEEVKRRMLAHGVDKVRGGSYSTVVLPDEVVAVLQRELRHAQDLCLKCGDPGHWAVDCRRAPPRPPGAAPAPAPTPGPESGPADGATDRPRRRFARGGSSAVDARIASALQREIRHAQDRAHDKLSRRAEGGSKKVPCPPEIAPVPALATGAGAPLGGSEPAPGPAPDSPSCARCGRASHAQDACYAKTTADGRRLAPRPEGASQGGSPADGATLAGYGARWRELLSAADPPGRGEGELASRLLPGFFSGFAPSLAAGASWDEADEPAPGAPREAPSPPREPPLGETGPAPGAPPGDTEVSLSPAPDDPRCARCGRASHAQGACYAKTTAGGRQLSPRQKWLKK